MPSRSEYEQQRVQYAAETETQMNAKIRAMQRRLYSVLGDALAGLIVDRAGKLVFNARNLTQADRVGVIIDAFQTRENVPFLRWLFRRLIGLLRLNNLYFKASGLPVASVEDNVRALMLRRYGYDTKKDRIIRGGYLSSLGTSENLALNILRRVNDAIAARQTLQDFRQVFRAEFTGAGGLGMVERHYKTFTNDLFAEFDRGVQKEYSERLGLGFAIYAPNSIMSRTRPFCERRVGNIYKDDEISKWNGQDWKGKIPGKPVEIQCGGYNCRHHLHYISEEDATRLLKRRGRELNQYNQI